MYTYSTRNLTLFSFPTSPYVPGSLHPPLQGSLKYILLVAKCHTEHKTCDSIITKAITNKYQNKCWPSKNSLWETMLIIMKLPWLEIFSRILFWNCVQRACFTNHLRKWISLPCGHTLSILAAVNALRMGFKLRCFEFDGRAFAD